MNPCWKFSCDPAQEFLPHAAACFTSAVTVCIEHASTDKRAIALYHSHPGCRDYWQIRDTIEPHSNLYYCELTHVFTNSLVELCRQTPVTNLLWHFRGYERERMLFYCHDADLGCDILLSPLIPDDVIEKLSSSIGCRAKRTESIIDWQTIVSRGSKQKKT